MAATPRFGSAQPRLSKINCSAVSASSPRIGPARGGGIGQAHQRLVGRSPIRRLRTAIGQGLDPARADLQRDLFGDVPGVVVDLADQDRRLHLVGPAGRERRPGGGPGPGGLPRSRGPGPRSARPARGGCNRRSGSTSGPGGPAVSCRPAPTGPGGRVRRRPPSRGSGPKPSSGAPTSEAATADIRGPSIPGRRPRSGGRPRAGPKSRPDTGGDIARGSAPSGRGSASRIPRPPRPRPGA